jgi:hypothetical protein
MPPSPLLRLQNIAQAAEILKLKEMIREQNELIEEMKTMLFRSERLRMTRNIDNILAGRPVEASPLVSENKD